MSILLTGAAGFIGYHVSRALLARGETVIGVDNLNDYYDVALKEARLAQLTGERAFSLRRANIADRAAIEELCAGHPEIDRIVHLAAQAGVRYSLVNPFAYTESNISGHLVMLEAARRLPKLAHMVYASSSSVYGGNTKLPFAVSDPVDRPISLYAATKRAGELMAYNYSHLYGLPLTGLRFFTVYGPWGRPDMSAFLFTKAILASEPIKVFNNGDMRRDFTFIDDIVAGVLARARPSAAGRRRAAAASPLQSRQPSQRAAHALHRGDRAGRAIARRASSSRRCSRATCRRPMPTSRPRRATSASCRARRSTRGSRASWPGFGSITSCSRDSAGRIAWPEPRRIASTSTASACPRAASDFA